MAPSAVLPVLHRSHEDAGSALLWVSTRSTLGEDTEAYRIVRALSPKPLNLAVAIDLVVLEDGELALLAFMLDLFGCVVNRQGMLIADRWVGG